MEKKGTNQDLLSLPGCEGPSVMEYPMLTKTGRSITVKAVFEPNLSQPVSLSYWFTGSKDHVVSLYGDGGSADTLDEALRALQRDTVTDAYPLICFILTAAALYPDDANIIGGYVVPSSPKDVN